MASIIHKGCHEGNILCQGIGLRDVRQTLTLEMVYETCLVFSKASTFSHKDGRLRCVSWFVLVGKIASLIERIVDDRRTRASIRGFFEYIVASG